MPEDKHYIYQNIKGGGGVAAGWEQSGACSSQDWEGRVGFQPAKSGEVGSLQLAKHSSW